MCWLRLFYLYCCLRRGSGADAGTWTCGEVLRNVDIWARVDVWTDVDTRIDVELCGYITDMFTLWIMLWTCYVCNMEIISMD